MANEFARNIQDASINPAAFALPAAASTFTTSASVDLGADVYKGSNFEVELAVPALSDTIVPNTRTVTYLIETATDSAFTAVDRTVVSQTYTGAGSGVAAKTIRARLPSDSARYLRGKVTFGASTTTGAAVSATLSLRF